MDLKLKEIPIGDIVYIKDLLGKYSLGYYPDSQRFKIIGEGEVYIFSTENRFVYNSCEQVERVYVDPEGINKYSMNYKILRALLSDLDDNEFLRIISSDNYSSKVCVPVEKILQVESIVNSQFVEQLKNENKLRLIQQLINKYSLNNNFCSRLNDADGTIPYDYVIRDLKNIMKQ